MQSSKRTTRRETGPNGLAVPIALLALLVIGVLVTGAFYVFSHEPDNGHASKVSVGQSVVPAPSPQSKPVLDSMQADTLNPRVDTSAPGGGERHAPLSVNPIPAASVQRTSLAEPLSVPAGRASAQPAPAPSGSIH